jgi:hypothetical protein
VNRYETDVKRVLSTAMEATAWGRELPGSQRGGGRGAQTHSHARVHVGADVSTGSETRRLRHFRIGRSHLDTRLCSSSPTRNRRGTTMARPKNTLSATPAHSASQPLFDALREATNALSEQKAHLQKARDTVQKVHVKLAQSETDSSNGDHSTYISAAVKAWRSATEAYSNIFDELAKIAAADPSEGKDAARGHEGFTKMAQSARKARKIALDCTMVEEGKEESGPAVGSKRGGEKVGRKAKRAKVEEKQNDSTTATPAQPKADGTKREFLVSRTKRSSPDDEAAHAHQPTPNKRSRRSSAPEPSPFHTATNATTPGAQTDSLSHGKENRIPGVVYEDINAEVEARLKSKSAKKRARMKDKKRKRESMDSTLDPSVAVRAVMEGVQKPLKKKAKSESTTPAEESQGQGQGQAGKRKRKSSFGGVENGEGGGGGSGGKARKKKRFH